MIKINEWIQFIQNSLKLYYNKDLKEAMLSDNPIEALKEELNRELPKLEVSKRVDRSKIRSKLKKVAPDAQIWISDQSYGLLEKDKLNEFLEENKIDLEEYRAVKHDCDDFSFRLLGATTEWCADLSIGIIWGDSHAFNLFIDPDMNVWSIEPQTDEIEPLNQKIDKEDIWLIVM